MCLDTINPNSIGSGPESLDLVKIERVTTRKSAVDYIITAYCYDD